MKKLLLLIFSALLFGCVNTHKHVYVYNQGGIVIVEQTGSNADDSLNGNKPGLTIPLINK